MSEHSKIEVPDDGAGRSLLERAAKRFDLDAYSAPPVPSGLAQVRPKPVARPVQPEPVAAPAQPAAASAPRMAPEPMAPEPMAPEPIVVKEEVVVAARAAPVVFRGREQHIDREHLRAQGLIVPEGSVTALLEEFRIVKRQLLLQAADLRRQGVGPSAQRVLVCSPHSGEGKTYCSVNLALSIAAERENEVLLVDADFAKPTVLSTLGLQGGPGLMDALTDPAADVADFVIRTDIPGLSVLPAGHATNADSEHLNSSRTPLVLDRLTEGAPQRMVIFDSPPALAAAPAAELAKFVGQAVMIVRADSTGQGSLEDAISLLSGCPNIQLLLNAVQFSPSGRRFGSYYGYGG